MVGNCKNCGEGFEARRKTALYCGGACRVEHFRTARLKLRILVSCESSGVVRDAFRARGHNAISCDLLPSESSHEHHIQGNVLDILDGSWDMLIAFPPCRDLAVSGARWWADRKEAQEASLAFVAELMNAPIRRIAIENPVGLISTRLRKPTQIIQPYEFGHGEVKRTCLWLKNLPRLRPTQVVEGRYPRVHREAPGPDRWKARSRTYAGIAEAMASQWG